MIDRVEAHEISHDSLHLCYRSTFIAGVGDGYKLIGLTLEILVVEFYRLGPEYLLILCGDGLFLVIEEFLTYLLAWTQTDVFNLYVDTWTETTQTNHTGGKISNLNGLAHIEDKHVATFT